MIKDFIVSKYARITDIVCIFSAVLVLIYSAVMWHLSGVAAALIALVIGVIYLVICFGFIYCFRYS